MGFARIGPRPYGAIDAMGGCGWPMYWALSGEASRAADSDGPDISSAIF